jgi:hypothetical protein
MIICFCFLSSSAALAGALVRQKAYGRFAGNNRALFKDCRWDWHWVWSTNFIIPEAIHFSTLAMPGPSQIT